MGVKKAKRAAREQLAAAQLMTAELEAALDRLEGLESSVLSGGASVAAAEAGLVAGVAGFEAQVEHASTNIDDRVDAVSAGAARAMTIVEDASGHVQGRAGNLLADLDRRITDLLHDVEASCRAANERVAAATDSAIAQIEARACEQEHRAQVLLELTSARLEAQTRQHEHQAEVLLEHFSNRLDELLAAVDRADDTAPRAEPAPPPPTAPAAPTAPTATELQNVVAEAPVTEASVTLPVRSVHLPVPGARSAAPVSAKTRVSAAQLHASLDALRRTAVGDWVHAELTFNALRLTVFDKSGWWEFHDVPVEGTQLDRTWTTIDMGELVAALDVERQHVENDRLELTLDGDDIVIGTTLVLSRTVEAPSLTGTRRKVEPIDLGLSGCGDLVLDSQLGRLRVPSRLVSLLRSRQGHDVHLVTIGERPFLRAQVVGVSDDVLATILAELADESVAPDGEGGERRDTAHSPVTDLIGALTPTTSAEELAAILTSGVEYARRRAASHPTLPADLLEATLRHDSDAMRAAAAANPSLSTMALADVAGDEASPVRVAVAAHRNASAELLDELARDDVVAVREQAAANPSLAAAAHLRLTQDAYAAVRAALATNVGISDELLGVLARDPDPRVCAAVASSARCPQDLLDTLFDVVPEAVLGNPQAPERLLSAAARAHSATLRTVVAGNLSTPVRQLDALSRDEAREVRAAVAANVGAPAHVRRRAHR